MWAVYMLALCSKTTSRCHVSVHRLRIKWLTPINPVCGSATHSNSSENRRSIECVCGLHSDLREHAPDVSKTALRTSRLLWYQLTYSEGWMAWFVRGRVATSTITCAHCAFCNCATHAHHRYQHKCYLIHLRVQCRRQSISFGGSSLAAAHVSMC